MGDKELAAEIQIETHGELGLISKLGPRKSFPMKGLTARQFAKDRVILIGEAAHVVPPIGAQGLNMSLRDAALADVAACRGIAVARFAHCARVGHACIGHAFIGKPRRRLAGIRSRCRR